MLIKEMPCTHRPVPCAFAYDAEGTKANQRWRRRHGIAILPEGSKKNVQHDAAEEKGAGERKVSRFMQHGWAVDSKAMVRHETRLQLKSRKRECDTTCTIRVDEKRATKRGQGEQTLSACL